VVVDSIVLQFGCNEVVELPLTFGSTVDTREEGEGLLRCDMTTGDG
jgi:hypothetical protein